MKKLLYVEDDVINALIMKKLMSPYYDVKHVSDGDACLKILQSEAFDLILMDINLGRGKMDGIETMKKLRAFISKRLPVIAVTSYAMPEDEARFIREGFEGYVTKPIDQQNLLVYLTQFAGNQ